ncbi:M9 family metallopeptidase [Simiduia litorea]|uniref:collagenase n=1 Tax=Simiduia litorea TaxID=1435348 RepID=UPI0036F43A96
MNINNNRGLLTLSLSLSLLASSFSMSSSAQQAPLSQSVPNNPHSQTHIAPVEPLPDRNTVQTPVLKTQKLATTMAAVAACDTNGYATKTGQSLVDHILSQDISCINDLYTANATSFAAFQSPKMVTVANATASMAASYRASGGSTSINNLYYFLRTGYYHEYYSPNDVGPYASDVKNAVRSALDNLVNNVDFYANSDQHGKNIKDAIILIDSAGENARYLPMVKQWLSRWNASYATSPNMRASVNGIFTVLYRGHYQADFQALVKTDTQLAQQLGNFARQDWMLATDAIFLQENAAGELARFLQYKTAAAYPTIKSEVQAILNRYSLNGTGRSVWLRTATVIDYQGQCADFNICGFKAELEAQVLPLTHTCSSSLVMRAEAITNAQFADSCNQLSVQESYFHEKLATSYNPVAGDLNTKLEMVVFNNSTSYQENAGVLFGIDTNNGGMYLEGNPADANNQARFIAYEAEWLLPEFHIWNLTHEYVHYLDGRFNLKGDFAAAKTGTHKTVWWIEGLAEYISKKDFNDTAINLARTKAFTLGTIFSNDYNSGQDRVYRWGYLAVRFMFERHPSEVNQMLQYFRAGNYDAYLSYINSISNLYENEWNTWLGTVQSTNTPTPPVDDKLLTNGQARTIASPSNNSPLEFYIDVPTNATNLSFAISGGTGDADIYVKRAVAPTSSSYDCRPYRTGNAETCSFAAPGSGRWYVHVYSYATFANVSLVASYSAGGNSNTPPTAVVNGPYTGTAQQSVNFSSNGSTDSDGSIASYAWNFGDGNTSALANPSHTYASAGNFTVQLTVTDNQGASHSASTTATINQGGGNGLSNSCLTQSATDYVSLSSQQPVCVTAKTNGTLYFYFYVNNATQLTLRTGFGSGNANLYYSNSGWPSTTQFSKSSTGAGNSETITVNNPSTGWHYVMISGTHAGLTLQMDQQ